MMWFDFRKTLTGILSEIEPMIFGLFVAGAIHFVGIYLFHRHKKNGAN